jgi:hypothetical protein
MSHNGVIGRYSRYSVLPLFAVMESVLALRYRFYRAGRSWEGARKDRVHFPPYQGDFIRFSNIDIKIIVSFVSEMGNNLTKNGRQMRKHKEPCSSHLTHPYCYHPSTDHNCSMD